MPKHNSFNQGAHNGNRIKGTSKWICPNDETINTGERCVICGYARPTETPVIQQSITDKIKHYLPRATMLGVIVLSIIFIAVLSKEEAQPETVVITEYVYVSPEPAPASEPSPTKPTPKRTSDPTPQPPTPTAAQDITNKIFATTGKTLSTKGVLIEYPRSRDIFKTVFFSSVVAKAEDGCIYIMPKPEEGNGNLGTVNHGTAVTIWAYRNGYYFFETPDGVMGWNGVRYFSTRISKSEQDSPNKMFSTSGNSLSTKNVSIEYPKSSELCNPAFPAAVKGGGGYIFIMPKPEEGNGNLGTVDAGTAVTILASRGNFYFFETVDGVMGWNGSGYFRKG